jgi:hypothetical protein
MHSSLLAGLGASTGVVEGLANALLLVVVCASAQLAYAV